ncbi:MAG TPA: asparagine synthase (glutamine-hydrolyzing), partial [Sphingobacteriaceae bacterium]
MCGIAGFIDYTKKADKATLKLITDKLSHRGPDDSGFFFEQNRTCNIGLGHRRLSVIDLSHNGHQPMFFNDLAIIFNGEIYNFKEIQHELFRLGYSFQSESDTEVIIKAFHAWGANMLKRFIGMFAIVIYDKKANKVWCFRDRAGVKPFFYSWNNGVLLFSSELKSIISFPNFSKKLNDDAVLQYTCIGYIPAPNTIFKNVYKLKPGTFICIDLISKQIDKECYWDIVDFANRPKLDISYEESKRQLEDLFRSAFNYRLVSDVKTGLFFSGGYDSTAVASILQANSSDKLKTFTIGFNDKEFDESVHAKKIARIIGTDHHEFICSEHDALAVIDQLPEIFDEPISDNSCIPTYLLSKLTRNEV